MKEKIKRLMEVFLICHFLISMAVGICGTVMEPDYLLNYTDLFDPAIMALFCTLPTLLETRINKISTVQFVVRKVIQILIIEGIVLSMIYFGSIGLRNSVEVIVVAVAVLFVYCGVSVIDWISSYLEAEDLNRKLAQMQDREKSR